MVLPYRFENETNQRYATTQASIGELRNYVGKNFKTLNNNIRCFGGTIEGSFVRQRTQQSDPGLQILPLNQGVHNYNQLEEVIKPAELSHNPHSLQMLWREYKVGLNGLKAAEQFSMNERNVSTEMAQKYSWRNKVWQCIQRLVNAGWTCEVTIQKIHRVYGYDTSPTKIIEGMIADRKKYKQQGGFHPDLQ